MAKLHDYHILCPLIDQKSFLGISQDKTPEHVIVTLGRNVVNRYRLSDQKQISGWTSKDHITSPVIYDKEQNNYVGVFNQNTVKMWDEDVSNLDKLKKHKFSTKILKLIPRNDQPPLIIFANGNCAALPYAIENRKTYDGKALIKDTDEIIDIASFKINNQDYICYVIKTSVGHEIVHCSLRAELGDMEKVNLGRERIARDDAEVIGMTISVKPTVFVIWNDAKLSSYNINTKIWKTVGTVQWVSTKSTVSMSWMAKNHLIIFGSNKEQDGAVIIAYNFTLGVGSCKYPMKMYKENARIYACRSHQILIEASNHIGMLPFTLEIKRNLSSLLGSHEIAVDNSPVVANWGTATTPLYNYSEELNDAVTQGISERNACAQTMPPLLEHAEPYKIIAAIRGFKDIPESVLTLLLSHAVKSIKSIIDITKLEDVKKICRSNEDTELQQLDLLNEIFKITFCDALVIPHLRNAISVNESLFLLMYIEQLLTNFRLDQDYESRLYDWCELILDAFYQQYLLCKDPMVHTVLDRLRNSVSRWVNELFKMNTVMAQLNKLMSGNNNVNDEEYLPYTIEMMQI